MVVAHVVVSSQVLKLPPFGPIVFPVTNYYVCQYFGVDSGP
jgi:hypothetical protein